MAKNYDLVLFGASGYTGQYVLEEFVRSFYYGKHTFAIAGRNRAKLEKTLQTVGDYTGQDLKIPILVADSSDYDALLEVTKQATVVISVVGPFRLYGELLVKACVEGKASYVDISGEPSFIEKMDYTYREQAEQNGVYIISACGFDSIPCDLGVQYLKDNFPGTLAYVETVAQGRPGPQGYKINDGTYQTIILSIENMSQDNIREIRKQLMPEKLERLPFKAPKRPLVWKDERTGRYVLPFLGSDRSIVIRSQYNDAIANKKYPPYVETYFAAPSAVWAYLILTWMAFVNLLTKFGPTRQFLKDYPDIASFGAFSKTGSNRAQVKSTTFTYYIHGTGWPESEPQVDKIPNRQLTVRVDGPDMGYIGTAGCVLSAALTIVEDKDNLPSKGGAFTPATAFAKTNIHKRLESFNITFKTV
ncbi:unnamed protein product [Bursaphelenchus okinawaensis]|uniref:Saccharopine dehydrogenase NADP binding domain-containing protein n=1 Tax=Bursaphelenchus okinawaensis TaxID=465554 RepID=A0A811KLF1_9BILA|nr:unnamed protein product [Bursaphelenchus okinawaensis]CAG9105905.1 unnamed protein product [Bursaphelenchus okinawaensis]